MGAEQNSGAPKRQYDAQANNQTLTWQNFPDMFFSRMFTSKASSDLGSNLSEIKAAIQGITRLIPNSPNIPTTIAELRQLELTALLRKGKEPNSPVERLLTALIQTMQQIGIEELKLPLHKNFFPVLNSILSRVRAVDREELGRAKGYEGPKMWEGRGHKPKNVGTEPEPKNESPSEPNELS